MEDHENGMFIIEDRILINLGAPEESQQLKIEKSLTLEEQQSFISLLRELINSLHGPIMACQAQIETLLTIRFLSIVMLTGKTKTP